MTARRVSPETRARRAKAEAERLGAEVERVKRLYHDKDGELNVAREAAIRDKAERDFEAVAIDGCIKALDALPTGRRADFYLGSKPAYPDVVSVGRVLDYLHERFVGPRPSEAELTRQLAEAHDRIRTLSGQLDSVRCTLGPL